MTTIVHLVRHGEVHNPAKILYGRLEGYQLSERGRNMAHATATDLADHDVTFLGAVSYTHLTLPTILLV